jgi:hypothetical protein
MVEDIFLSSAARNLLLSIDHPFVYTRSTNLSKWTVPSGCVARSWGRRATEPAARFAIMQLSETLTASVDC